MKYSNWESEWSLKTPGDNEVILVGFVVKLGRKLQATGTKEYQILQCLQTYTEFPKHNCIANIKIVCLFVTLRSPPKDSEKVLNEHFCPIPIVLRFE